MKSNKLKTVLSIIFLAFLFASCSKENDNNLGTINISFKNIDDKPSSWEVKIFTVENPSITIYSKTLSASLTEAQVKLMAGNYIIRPSTHYAPHLFTAVSFQLTHGKTINVWYDENWIGHIR
ncbi:MAG: hypothetical protein LBF04_03450 [Prevotellaceae bacterium]|jgi:PBP1b-binding outer membrane lipoprotein LpoB|nr:hypothetical protein [Prevotellaceae bacterium]